MSNVLRVAIADPNDSTRSILKSMLLGIETVWLEAECSRYEFFYDVVEQTSPDVGIVSIDANKEKAFELIDHLSSAKPDCAIFVLSSSDDGNMILRVMRSGAKEFLQLPLQLADLLQAFNRLRDKKHSTDNRMTQRTSMVTAIIGTTGGVGDTTIAVNLASHWASNPQNSVALIDLDLFLGDVDIFLDIIPDYTLVDVAQNVSRIDYSLLKRSLTKHSSGLYLLPRPMDLNDIPYITPENIGRVVGLLKVTFSHLVLDLSKSFTPVDLAALELADSILLVTLLDLTCLRNAVRLLTWLEQKDGMVDKVKVVVNRQGHHQNQITPKKAQESIRRDLYWLLPNDYRAVEESRGAGLSLHDSAPKAAITQSIAGLADKLSGKAPDMDFAAAGGSKLSLGKIFNTFLSGSKPDKPEKPKK